MDLIQYAVERIQGEFMYDFGFLELTMAKGWNSILREVSSALTLYGRHFGKVCNTL